MERNMMRKEEIAEKAVEYKHNGFNCAQAVVGAMAEYVDADKEGMIKVASGFGAGMGCMEATCGALVGASMIAGLVLDGKGTAGKSREILQQFHEMSGATICKDLKGISTGEVLCSCDDCVRNAVNAAVDILGLEK